MADNFTLDRAQSLGLNPDEFLKDYDSYHFFEKLGDLRIYRPHSHQCHGYKDRFDIINTSVSVRPQHNCCTNRSRVDVLMVRDGRHLVEPAVRVGRDQLQVLA